MLEASNFVHTIENRQGLKIACLEEIAYRQDFIDEEQVCRLAWPLRKSNYGRYLMQLVDGNAALMPLQLAVAKG